MRGPAPTATGHRRSPPRIIHAGNPIDSSEARPEGSRDGRPYGVAARAVSTDAFSGFSNTTCTSVIERARKAASHEAR